MTRIFPILLSLCLCCCSQNQLILDPFDEGESLMIEDEEAIIQFEQMMEGIASPDNEYKSGHGDKNIFSSPDVLNTYQDTQPTMGICRSGDKEYYYHIERDHRGTLITDLDLSVTDYIVSPEKYRQITDFIRIHTPVPESYETTDENEPGDPGEDNPDADTEEETGNDE